MGRIPNEDVSRRLRIEAALEVLLEDGEEEDGFRKCRMSGCQEEY